MALYTPNTDGIDHINIYSKGKTQLGRMLSNFYHCPIETEDGKFQSVEAYWAYLSIEPCEAREALRSKFGFQAKQLERELLKSNKKNFEPEFEKKILAAIEEKIKHNTHLLSEELLRLPLRHYYCFGTPTASPKIMDVTDKYDWMIRGISELCKKHGKVNEAEIIIER